MHNSVPLTSAAARPQPWLPLAYLGISLLMGLATLTLNQVLHPGRAVGHAGNVMRLAEVQHAPPAGHHTRSRVVKS